MKFVLGFFWALAAEQRAIVGELCYDQHGVTKWVSNVDVTYFLEMASVKKKFSIGFLSA